MRYHWENRRKCYHNGRLEWFGTSADEQYWADYWQKTLTTSHYEQLANSSLEDSPLGKILSSELRKTDRIIEAGCGSGDWVAMLKNHGFTFIEGIDYSDEVIQRVNQIAPELPVRNGDALHITAEPNSFDAYLSFGVIEHRFNGPEPFLNEAHRILKPGGKALFSVPCLGSLRKLKAQLGFYRDDTVGCPFFQYGFTLEELRTILTKHGFQIQRYQYLGIDRMWMEEVYAYSRLAQYNTIRRIQKHIANTFEGSDGHMLMLIAIKPI